MSNHATSAPIAWPDFAGAHNYLCKTGLTWKLADCHRCDVSDVLSALNEAYFTCQTDFDVTRCASPLTFIVARLQLLLKRESGIKAGFVELDDQLELVDEGSDPVAILIAAADEVAAADAAPTRIGRLPHHHQRQLALAILAGAQRSDLAKILGVTERALRQQFGKVVAAFEELDQAPPAVGFVLGGGL